MSECAAVVNEGMFLSVNLEEFWWNAPPQCMAR